MLLLADALGLSLFAIIGAEIAQGSTDSPIVIVLIGVISGVAGDVVRDVLCNEIPLILQSGRRGSRGAAGAIEGVGTRDRSIRDRRPVTRAANGVCLAPRRPDR